MATALRLELPTPFGPVAVELPVEEGAVPITRVADAARILVEAVQRATVERVERAGRSVRCAAGCSMCCHHLVGISPIEALLLDRAVERLPQADRERIALRTAEAETRLQELGLLDRAAENPAGDAGRTLVRDYFAARVACPLLHGHRCSVYADRPVPCRQLLVLSDPEHCADPLGGSVEAVPVFHNLQPALEAVSEAVCPDAPPRMPLVVALGWARKNREKRQLGAAHAALVRGLLQALTGR